MAITTVYGNVRMPQATANAARLIRLCKTYKVRLRLANKSFIYKSPATNIRGRHWAACFRHAKAPLWTRECYQLNDNISTL